MFALDDYDYDLPEERIAQRPTAQRDQSRLLVMDRRSGALSHRGFTDLDSLLAPSDVLVLSPIQNSWIKFILSKLLQI